VDCRPLSEALFVADEMVERAQWERRAAMPAAPVIDLYGGLCQCRIS
jgi:hypothetical protein